MIPYILAAVGGYLIGQSQKKDVMANGGNVVDDEKLKYGQMFGGDGKPITIFEPIKGYEIYGEDGKNFIKYVEVLKYPNYAGKGPRYYYDDSLSRTRPYSSSLEPMLNKMNEDIDKWKDSGFEVKEINYSMADGGMMAMGGTTETLRKFDDGGMTDKKIEGLESALNNPNLSPKVKRQLKMKLNEMKAIKEGRYSDESKYGKFDNGGMMNNSYFPFGNLSKRRNDLYDLVNAMEEDEYKNFCSEYELNPYEADEVNDFIHKCQSPGIIIEEIESGQYK